MKIMFEVSVPSSPLDEPDHGTRQWRKWKLERAVAATVEALGSMRRDAEVLDGYRKGMYVVKGVPGATVTVEVSS